MKFPQPIPVREIAERLHAELVGDAKLMATGINEIHHAEEGDIIFVDVRKYFNKSFQSAASIILINEKAKCPKGKALLVVDNPFEAYNRLVLECRPFQPLQKPVSDSAQIDPTTIIEPNVTIGHQVRIGKHCYIQSNVYLGDYTVIGDHVTIYAGSVIGTDAFYFKRNPDGYQKWRSGGRVVLEDHVDIGPGCTINKGVSSDTIIGAGTKLDGQIHIGHDVRVGKNCLIAAQVGIAGNTVIGDEVVLFGQVGIAQNLQIGNKVMVSAKSGVSKDLEEGKIYFGYPAGEASTVYRELAALRHLPAFFAEYYK